MLEKEIVNRIEAAQELPAVQRLKEAGLGDAFQ